MARYILIDNYTGFIYGYQTNLPNFRRGPLEFAATIDCDLGISGREYVEVPRLDLAYNETGYHVYEAPDGLPFWVAGKNKTTIDEVLACCTYLTSIRCREIS